MKNYFFAIVTAITLTSATTFADESNTNNIDNNSNKNCYARITSNISHIYLSQLSTALSEKGYKVINLHSNKEIDATYSLDITAQVEHYSRHAHATISLSETKGGLVFSKSEVNKLWGNTIRVVINDLADDLDSIDKRFNCPN